VFLVESLRSCGVVKNYGRATVVWWCTD